MKKKISLFRSLWTIATILPAVIFTESLDGIYHSDIFRVYFRNDIGTIGLDKTNKGILTGLDSFDNLLTEYQVREVVQWLPTATEIDRDGDIFLSRFYDIHLPAMREDILTVVEVFQRDDHIQIAERIPIHRLTYTPNDPKYSQQWYLPAINTPEAWDMWDISGGETPGDPSIVIGIVDSGCDWDHPDLIDNLWQNLDEDSDGDGHTIEYIDGSWQLDPGDLNNVDDDGNGYVDDLIGWDIANQDNDPVGPQGQGTSGFHMHGTHVAGISAAVTNNGIGMASTGWSVKYMPVKTMEDDDPDDLIIGGYQGILYAAKAGADIINCSWGGYEYSSSEQSIINSVYNNYNVIIVAAAGNGDNAGNEADSAHYPSSYNHVVSVTALGSNNQWNHWATYHESVDLSAPGESILSTVYSNISGGYQSWSGTSMASPVVASSYGLLWSFFPNQTREWVESRLIETANPVIYEVNQESYLQGRLGSGRVDIFAAIANSTFPNLSIYSYSLQMVDDDDGVLNPGETAKMRVVILNEEGWAEATDVVAILSSTHPDIIIIDDTATFLNITSGGSGVNISDRFEFMIVSSAIPGDIPVTITITANENYITEDYFDIEVSLVQSGFPFITSNSIKSSPAIVDLDGDGQLELLIGSDDKNLYALNNDGSLRWTFQTGDQIRSTPAIADLDKDGDLEIVFCSKDKILYILDEDGNMELEYVTNGSIVSTPALSDLDGDSDLEIIFGDSANYLYVIHHDGTDYESFPVNVNESLMTAPAIGDINGDGSNEIVVGTWSNNVYAYNLGGSVLSGFPFTTGGRINSDPALADLDGDGKLEILVGSDDNNLYAIDYNGVQVFVYGTGSDLRGSPVVEDIDGDGEPEIFFGSVDRNIYGIDRNGNDLPGWPFTAASSVKSAPVFYDLDGDGHPEIIAVDLGGKVYALTFEGEMYPNFPVTLDGTTEGSFSVADIDGDGDPEIAVGIGNSLYVIDVKSQGIEGDYWNMYRGNLLRTGNSSYSTVSDTVLSIPAEFHVKDNYPNPFNPVTVIEYSLPHETQVLIDVFNLLGQKITTLLNVTQSAGYHQIRWDATNTIGEKVAGGIYFIRIKTEVDLHIQKVMYLK